MPLGAAISEGSSGEGISHFAAIRIRMNGTGLLRMSACSLDDLRIKILIPFQMDTWARRIPTRIVNFVEQRASFQISVVHMDEVFKINRIVIFAKEIYTSSPHNAVPADLQLNPLALKLNPSDPILLD